MAYSIRAHVQEAVEAWTQIGFGLHMKGALIGESFMICRNWVALGGTVSPGSVKSQDVNASEIQKIKRLINGW